MQKRFQIFLWHVMLLLGTVGAVAESLTAQNAPLNDAAIQSRIASALQETSFDATTLDLDAILQDALASGITYQPSTQNTFFSALQWLFTNRFAKKYQDPSQTLPIEEMNLLFSSAPDSNLISPPQKSQLGAFIDTTMLEELIFDLKTQSDYTVALATLRALLAKASGKSFVPEAQKMFFTNLTSVFNGRAGANKATPLSPSQMSLLISQLTIATKTPLLNLTDQATAQTYLAILTLEQNIMASALIADYSARIDALIALITSHAGITLTDITQNIFDATLQTMFKARPQTNPPLLLKLRNFLTNNVLTSNFESNTQKNYIQTALLPALNTNLSAAQPQAANQNTMPSPAPKAQLPASMQQGSSLSAQSITNAKNAPTYQAQLTGLLQCLNQAQGQSFDPATQNLFASALMQLFNNRVNQPPMMLQALINLLGAAINSPLLTPSQQAYVKNILLPALGVTTPPTVLNNPIAPAPRTGLFTPNKSARQARTAIAGQTRNSIALTPHNLKRVRHITSPHHQIAALRALLDGARQPTITPDIQQLLMQRITNLIQQLISLDAAALQQLLQLIQNLLSTTILMPAQQTALATQVPIINNAVIAATTPTPQAIINATNISDPVARIDTLSILFNNTSATTPITPQTQNTVAASLDKLMTSSPGFDTVTLNKLLALLQQAQRSPLLAPAQQTYVTSTLLPRVTSSAAQANLPTVASLQTAMAQKNPSTQLDALSALLNTAATQQPNPQVVAEFSRVLGLLANAGPSLDPLAQSKLLIVLQQAPQTLPLQPALQQQLTTAVTTLNNILNSANTPGNQTPIAQNEPTTTSKKAAKAAHVKGAKAAHEAQSRGDKGARPKETMAGNPLVGTGSPVPATSTPREVRVPEGREIAGKKIVINEVIATDFDQQLALVKQATNFADQITALNGLSLWGSNKNISSQQQQTLYSFIQGLVAQCPSDGASQAAMSDALKRLQAAKLFYGNFKAEITNNLLSKLSAGA